MKFVIDTERKTVVLEESANLATFVELIEKMLGETWKEYTLQKTVSFEWRWNHVYVTPYVYPTFPTFYQTHTTGKTEKLPTIITYSSGGNSINGTVTGYNIQ